MNTLNYIISKKIKQKRKELGVTGIEKEMIKAKQSLSAESIMPIKKSDMYPT